MLTTYINNVTFITTSEVNQMQKETTSVVRRVPRDKANVLDRLASERKWTDTTTLNEVIEASPLFQDARKQYELSVNYG